jgi:hypothetical protein
VLIAVATAALFGRAAEGRRYGRGDREIQPDPGLIITLTYRIRVGYPVPRDRPTPEFFASGANFSLAVKLTGVNLE